MKKGVKIAAISLAALASATGAVVAADTLGDEDRPIPAPKARVHKHFTIAASGARLGVQITDITEELRAFFAAPSDAGVLVGRVEKDSPAAKAGIRVGDVIIKVDGDRVLEAFDVIRAMGEHEKGDQVPVVLVRDGKQLTLMAKLDEATDRGGTGMLPHGPNMWKMDPDFGPRVKAFGFGFDSDTVEKLEQRVQDLEKRLEKLENKR